MSNQPVDFFDKGDISKQIPPGTTKNQSMRGFDDTYVDIVDYIIRVTHRIWEEHDLAYLYETYQHNVVIWTSEGLTYSRETVMANSAKTQSAFPDIRLFGDDVIWAGNDEEGFHTSHRIMWVGHNTGYSTYGPPTGKKLLRAGIANCVVKNNYIYYEWIARDEMSLVLQLGYDPHETARRIVEHEARNKTGVPPIGEIERIAGQTIPPVLPPKTSNEFDPEDFVRRMFNDVWNWRRISVLKQYYATNQIVHAAAGREMYGHGDLRAFILSTIASFKDLMITVDQVYWNGNAQDGYRVMSRWTLQGTHDGHGIYGDPSGARIRIMGISHHHIKNEKISEEWMLFDEFAMLKQIYRAKLGIGK